MRLSQILTRAAQAAALVLATTTVTFAAGGGGGGVCAPKNVPHTDHHWSFQGVFGHYDHDAALRGFDVYQQVCAACHSLNQFSFRNLADLGATEDEIKGVAAEFEVPDAPNDEGEVKMRPARPSDKFPPPFPNNKAAAAANGGAFPPDLSLIVKSRVAFENHIPNILGGYMDAPAGCEVPEGKFYNAHFPGYIIGMAPPLSDDAIEYGDGTKATTGQMVQDVTQFLAYVAEPKLEERKRTGVKVVFFLIILTIMFYFVKRQVWRKVH